MHKSVLSKSKRVLDILGAIVGLVITAILFIPLAIAIKFDSRGPILFSQVRCGLHGKTFKIWKFRSMVQNAEQRKHLVKNEANGFIFKNINDPRVTKIGYFLRKTSLDEFPQFWNVLIGDMSLVGTRPPTVQEVSKYNSHHFARLNVKPGITGKWQISGRSLISNFEDIVALDIDYQNKWSFFYDVQIIFRTISVVLGDNGAF